MEKEFSTKAFIFVIVLSCSSIVLSLSILPRVTRRSDATIIDCKYFIFKFDLTCLFIVLKQFLKTKTMEKFAK